ncbi:MAG: TlpA family protein disulfide reductase, partial [Hymenobacteraceae bacterium]|nr:TlpA family protein disulfide reductase [Hymenobacteraceae bacterium]MDX5395060.1 TlpA family protein disulfide reductase [Hymenobacteraceae bacterium]MDX5511096.1 TlpA family protein disulfide reductase [Hymenobacteraceae bacterium]
ADITAKIEGDLLIGRWEKHDTPEPYVVPFKAEHGKKYRFSKNPAKPTFNYDGKWEVNFKNKEGKSYNAVGIFNQKGSKLSGTFLTATGDYRYLAGEVNANQLLLSAFDGNHAYLFKAMPVVINDSLTSDSTIQGEFFAGKSGYETWTAKRNEQAELPHADSLTYLKPGYERINFSFPNLEGQRVSLEDEKYQNKVVIVQLLGSWCPNCMDETAFLAPFYKKNRKKGIEVVGLGFEKSPEFEKAAARLERMKERYDIEYELLVAGTASKEAASQALPMLNQVISFPTTIFIDKKGKVRKIHTGFSGPGTGRYYDEFVQDFNQTVEKLLAE